MALSPLFAMAQDTGKPFKISGKTSKLPYTVDWVYIQYKTNGEWKKDSAKASNGSYEFTGKIEEAGPANIRVKYADQDGKPVAIASRRDVITVYIQPSKIKITSVDSFSNITVKGSAAHTEYAKLIAQAKPYGEKMQPLYALYSQFNKAKENSARDRVEAMIDSLDKITQEEVYGKYVKQNPQSPIALFALKQYVGWDIDPDKADPLFATLSDEVKNSPSGKDFGAQLEIAKKTGIGKIAMDFTQNDTLGNPVSLASFRGKYVLVDFWASWCGPCRAENPNVVKVFRKYKDQGFHIIGVSLDRPGQKEKWIKAIHDDELTWTQVSDLQFWSNEVAKQYGIQAIPQNLLLDPEGRIIAKNVRGEELDQKVGDAIAGKKGF
jgi:peroxiredoxin